jgi:succinyl-CoA synthetase beta subunit
MCACAVRMRTRAASRGAGGFAVAAVCSWNGAAAATLHSFLNAPAGAIDRHTATANRNFPLPTPAQIVINGLTGPVTTFVVEPFVPHEEEYYLSIQLDRWGGVCVWGGGALELWRVQRVTVWRLQDFAESCERPKTNAPHMLSSHEPRLGCDISFSTAGGVEIEENWDKVKTLTLATGQGPTSE